MALSPQLLELVRCPKCRGKLSVRASSANPGGLECSACRVVYPVSDDIPQLLIEEARPLGA